MEEKNEDDIEDFYILNDFSGGDVSKAGANPKTEPQNSKKRKRCI